MTQNDVLWLPSPAKLNLFLHVCGRFENGYHKLQTLFQLLNYGDELGFRPNHSGKICLKDNIDGVAESDNLIYQAACMLMPYRSKDPSAYSGIDIYLKKVLPTGGGIGGGSSNAATTLLALNTLWRCELDMNELSTLALKLGADVPVFVNGSSALASGIGEKLQPVDLPNSHYLVATPNVHISTEAIFTHPDLPRDTAKIDIAQFNPTQMLNKPHFDSTKNDCEKLVCSLHYQVANLLQWLLNYAPSRMTGTGASVFAVFASAQQANEVLSKLPKGVNGFVAKGVNRSPVHETLAKLKP
ncbi:4-(cytidine 5'-diphospho)-2-C-methyl-D-erythritol kinase [Ningiella sp. W23]|uniref:4-(cytidine 5'-diphospho)-2-C-methyl-D-erythritol kinase n=1 Tax=Ningiella sp. W23 TaxID=3023715 RepID=UPI003757B4AE